MAEGMDAATILDEIESLAATRRVRVEHVSRRRLESLARTEAPQGVVALARPVEETPLEALAEANRRGRVPFLLVLDGITDPHNMGALLRSAECAGVTGVVLPRHRSAHLSPTVAKVAAGAIEYLPIALVAGVPAALQRLSGLGVWTVGLVGESRQSLYTLPLGDQPVALVLGSEGSGLAELTRRRCDALGGHPPARLVVVAQRVDRRRHRLLRRGPPTVDRLPLSRSGRLRPPRRSRPSRMPRGR